MVMLPSFTVAAGRLVRPRTRPSVPLPSWFVVTVTVNGTNGDDTIIAVLRKPSAGRALKQLLANAV